MRSYTMSPQDPGARLFFNPTYTEGNAPPSASASLIRCGRAAAGGPGWVAAQLAVLLGGSLEAQPLGVILPMSSIHVHAAFKEGNWV